MSRAKTIIEMVEKEQKKEVSQDSEMDFHPSEDMPWAAIYDRIIQRVERKTPLKQLALYKALLGHLVTPLADLPQNKRILNQSVRNFFKEFQSIVKQADQQ